MMMTLESKDPTSLRKYFSFILQTEESSLMNEESNYYTLICKVLKAKQEQVTVESPKEITGLFDDGGGLS